MVTHRALRSSSSEDEDDGRDARRHRIRPRTFDGNTSFETFWAQFQNCVTYNRWKSDDQLAFLKASLVGDNLAWCVELKGDDLRSYSHKIESVSLRKCPHDH